MTPEPDRPPSATTLILAAMRAAGVAIDEEVLARVLPLVEAQLADAPLLIRAAHPALEPMSHPSIGGVRP